MLVSLRSGVIEILIPGSSATSLRLMGATSTGSSVYGLGTGIGGSSLSAFDMLPIYDEDEPKPRRSQKEKFLDVFLWNDLGLSTLFCEFPKGAGGLGGLYIMSFRHIGHFLSPDSSSLSRQC